jgi:hypothetical protein
MTHDTAGDPMTGLRWTRKTTQKVAVELESLGIEVSANTVGKLLKQMDFSLRVNQKKKSSGSGPDRNDQFTTIAKLREFCTCEGIPMVSVDAKKKEWVGNFKNAGAAWSRTATIVNDHDFSSMADGPAIPYGIYDMQANAGKVYVGTTVDTPEFAVDAVVAWWCNIGRTRYPGHTQLVIFADGGGSNSYRARAWKLYLQEKLCDPYGLTVRVAHYPAGASKWNPIEHRLFSEISKNWAGYPLKNYETVLNYIRTTKTSTGLTVDAELVTKTYEKGIKVSDEQMNGLNLECPTNPSKWNYLLKPRGRKMGSYC